MTTTAKTLMAQKTELLKQIKEINRQLAEQRVVELEAKLAKMKAPVEVKAEKKKVSKRP
jgi:Holliday junction resolvasome RuvABC DNA-binding subunit